VRAVLLSPILPLALLAGCAASTATTAPTGAAIVLEESSAEARTRTALMRIAELNPRLNAVIAVDPTAVAQARTLDRIRRARGPLFGMPVLVKDNIETAGPLPTTAGSLALVDNVTGRDAPLVARLRGAGGGGGAGRAAGEEGEEQDGRQENGAHRDLAG
jgi:amidase